MSSKIYDHKRIAKNTLYLYLRMGISMCISLYTSRVVLQVLGVTAYGVWSLVFTVITSISFITAPLSGSTQRFFNIYLANGNHNKVKDVFNTSVWLYIVFILMILIIFETLGLWFINHKLDIPLNLINQANVVYQLAIASFCISLLQIPLTALIIATEHFNFFAITGIIDVVVRLGIVYLLLVIHSIPHLILYAILSFCTSILMLCLYGIYCYRKYHHYISVVKPKDKSLVLEMLSFSGWNTFGAFATMSSNQGLSIIVNLFYGVVVNAAIGIANQVNNSLQQLVLNFQTAFQPQIIKQFAANEKSGLESLIQLASKISFLLVFYIGCPIIFNIDFILSIWLTTVPEYTSQFCVLLLICAWIEAVGGPLWMVVHASGEIKAYQLLISSTLILTLLLSYLFLHLGFPPIVIFQIKLLISLIVLFIRLKYTKLKSHIQIKFLLRTIIIPIVATTASGIIIFSIIKNIIHLDPYSTLFISSSLFYIFMIPLGLYICFKKAQRDYIFSFIKNKIIHRH